MQGIDRDPLKLQFLRAMQQIAETCGSLIVAEGIEDSFSVSSATGLDAWAAGSAPVLPYLAATVPDWVEVVTLVVDDDKADFVHDQEFEAVLFPLTEQVDAQVEIETRYSG